MRCFTPELRTFHPRCLSLTHVFGKGTATLNLPTFSKHERKGHCCSQGGRWGRGRQGFCPQLSALPRVKVHSPGTGAAQFAGVQGRGSVPTPGRSLWRRRDCREARHHRPCHHQQGEKPAPGMTLEGQPIRRGAATSEHTHHCLPAPHGWEGSVQMHPSADPTGPAPNTASPPCAPAQLENAAVHTVLLPLLKPRSPSLVRSAAH